MKIRKLKEVDLKQLEGVDGGACCTICDDGATTPARTYRRSYSTSVYQPTSSRNYSTAAYNGDCANVASYTYSSAATSPCASVYTTQSSSYYYTGTLGYTRMYG